MKSILTLFVVCLVSYTGFAQNWQEIKTTDSITILAQEIHYQDAINGMDHQRVVFKYVNHTSSSIEINFNRELIYDGQKMQQEEVFSLQIPANGTLQYDDSKNNNKTFYIFKKDHNGWIINTLTSYSLINLNVR